MNERPFYNDLTICTTTLYKGDDIGNLREAFAHQFFSNADNLGVRTVVVDGGSNQAFLESLSQYENLELYVEPEQGMGESRRFAFDRALEAGDTEAILWSEPEKYDLIRPEFLDRMIAPLRAGNSDIIVPHRTEATKATMPDIQRQFEFNANKRATNLMYGRDVHTSVPDGEEVDLFFGPKMFTRDGAHPFLHYPTQEGEMDYWDAIIKPVLLAHKEGLRVGSVDIDFSYDPREKELEEQVKKEVMEWKRALQQAGILAELGDPEWKERVHFTKRR